jgi:hypothetical protein
MLKQFQITLIVLVVMVFPRASLLVEGQPEFHCPNFQLQFQPPPALSGLIIYQSRGDLVSEDIRFSMINGASLESVPFPVPGVGYRGLSPDGNWLLVSDDTIYEHQLWLYSIDGQPGVKLLSASPRTYSWIGWLDENVTLLAWYRATDEGGVDTAVVKPESGSTWVVRPWIDFGGDVFRSYSPQQNLALVFSLEEFRYFVYDVDEGTSMFLPGTDLSPEPIPLWPPWSPDGGRLAYVLPTDFDERTESYYDELFVFDYPNQNIIQVSDFAQEFGVVAVTHEMHWSPDGKHLAFRMARIEKPGDNRNAFPKSALYILNIETGETKSLCVSPERHLFPPDFFWSPDSKYLAFVYEGDLVIADVATGVFSLLEENVNAVFDWRATPQP